MKIIVLGQKGNLGRQLMLALQDHDLVGLDIADFDIGDDYSVKRALAGHEATVIINAMAYNDVDGCEVDSEKYQLAYKLNVSLPALLADYCTVNEILLIHYSSDYVFGGVPDNEYFKTNGGFTENDKPQPINKYSQTKLKGEEELLARKDRGLEFYLIRTSKLFGPRGDSEFAKPGFFDIMLSISKEKNKLKVVDSEKSCFCYTPDLAEATRELLENKYEPGIYHLVNEGAVTWYEGAKKLFEIAKIDIELDPVSPDEFPRPAKRPEYSVLCNTKFRKLRRYERALEEYLEKI